MPEVNRFEIHGDGGVVRFDVVLEDAKTEKKTMKCTSAVGNKTLEDIQRKLKVSTV